MATCLVCLMQALDKVKVGPKVKLDYCEVEPYGVFT